MHTHLHLLFLSVTDAQKFIILTTVVNIVKLLFSSLTKSQNKLEHLSWTSQQVRLRAYQQREAPMDKL
jgi:hypothetical protein